MADFIQFSISVSVALATFLIELNGNKD